MSKRSFAFSLVAILAGFTRSSFAADGLTLGAPAPKLEVKEFIKGEPVTEFAKGKIYVVEFWATWCGPCRTSIPHVSELQKKYKDVTFIGVSVWEEDQKLVKPFVKEMGDKMDYRVAMDLVPEKGDANDGKMANNWMMAAGENGIPSSFIINGEGKVAWIGHPMEMDKPLEEIIAGKFDVAANAKLRAEAKDTQEKMMKVQGKLMAAQKEGDPKAMLKVLDEIFDETPALESQLGGLKFMILLQTGESKAAAAYGAKVYEDSKDDANALNNIAWSIVDPDRKVKTTPDLLKLAVKAASRGDELNEQKDAAVADTLAKALFDSGETAKAYEVQQRACKLAEGTPLLDGGMKERLEQYKKAIETAKDK